MRRALVFVGLVLVLGAWGPCAPLTTSGGHPMAGPTTSGLAALQAGEDWHYVGDTDEPAFLNGWVNFGGANAAALAFRIREAGVVDIQGVIKDGTNVTVFTLPEGYRPTTIVQVPITVRAPSTTNTSAGIMAVDTSGDVRVFYNNGSFPGTVFVYGQVFLSPPAVP